MTFVVARSDALMPNHMPRITAVLVPRHADQCSPYRGTFCPQPMQLNRTITLTCLFCTCPVVPLPIPKVCPRGFYEPAANASTGASGSCKRCEYDSYCPGGDKVENPTSKGPLVPCGTNIITRNTGARSRVECGEYNPLVRY